ncbi:TPA: cell wall-binding repeat-containing protein [Clostridioides difficile]|uniref:cell wall-binding repeat-containing protein n=1 Tax=Clostridioides difficile TaxID=1496 RepID=UPI00038D4EF7|nr:cell wall-binding repeat-containing protein [Clostridioides difficile]EGT5447990.1 cell surface protein [Clostridioides difficile]EII6835115.1 cell wall-binding repeat-containing protein [Clostridioides difficile]EIJ0742270.1 cell wall-binding repeat-containing protein [Clostridioides difficile]EQH99754.1 mannosyl-glycoendo-beta-N-acetylglucosaminidase family protein [Clostridioides difficile F314]MBF4708893.1 cell wall-binding repeat-containing protein [Clostridioides difficile]
MRTIRRVLALGLTLAIFLINVPNVDALTSDTIKGNNIYETAGLIADKKSYDTAIMVNMDNSIADGLSASGLAGAVDAPILLAQKNKIPNETKQRLKNVKKIYIIGKELSISKSVETELKNTGAQVTRLGGDDRIKTSYSVAKEVNGIKKVDEVILTNAYKGEADTISAAPISVRDIAPIVLTDGKSVPFSTSNVKTYAVGGSISMSTSLVNKTNAKRLGGSDRYDTNKKVIKEFYPDASEFYLSDGYDLVNALTGSTIAKENPIVLVSESSDKSILAGADKITRLGSISDSVYNKCVSAAQNNGDSSTKGESPMKNETSILGQPTASLETCLKWAKSKKANDLFIELIPILYDTAVQEGVNPVLAVAQSAKETGFCNFGGVLDASFKNPCGLKTSVGGSDTDKNAHSRFDTWEEGILAQIQHLCLYAGQDGYPLSNPVDPRHEKSLFGKAKTVESLSNNWAGGQYGQDLVRMMGEIEATK